MPEKKERYVPVDCTKCGGTGKIGISVSKGTVYSTTCRVCVRGRIPDPHCPRCSGVGSYTFPRAGGPGTALCDRCVHPRTKWYREHRIAEKRRRQEAEAALIRATKEAAAVTVPPELQPPRPTFDPSMDYSLWPGPFMESFHLDTTLETGAIKGWITCKNRDGETYRLWVEELLVTEDPYNHGSYDIKLRANHQKPIV